MSASALAGVAMSVAASVADFSQPPQTLTHWKKIDRDTSPFDARRWHLEVGLSAGSCRREDPDVASVDACGDLFVAVDWRFHARMHVDVELAAGLMPSATSGIAELGVAHSTGGPVYFAVRPAFGFDFTHLFFGRVGPQVRVGWALGQAVPGVHANVDLGGRIGRRFELGVRGFAGADGVAGSDGAQRFGFSFGALLFARCILL